MSERVPNDLVPTSRLLPGAPTNQSLVDLFLRGRSENTLRAYARCLKSFAAWLGHGDNVTQAVSALLAGGLGAANATVLQWRSELLEQGLAPKTINQRMAALRSCVKLGRTLGLVTWTLEVPDVKAEALKDTRGPGVPVVKALVQRLKGEDAAMAARDLAIVRLLYDLALRRFEVAGLDLEHVDRQASLVSVKGKGKHERKNYTLPPQTLAAIEAWIARRGEHPGALFTATGNRRSETGRLSLRALNRILAARGLEVGAERVKPHGLRHTAITEALERTGGDVRKVQQFSRHANVQTLLVYDDARRDAGGDISKTLAGGADEAP